MVQPLTTCGENSCRVASMCVCVCVRDERESDVCASAATAKQVSKREHGAECEKCLRVFKGMERLHAYTWHTFIYDQYRTTTKNSNAKAKKEL